MMPDAKRETFVCCKCGGSFPFSEEDDAAAMEESRSFFGDVPQEELAIVCDGCWEVIHPARN